MAWLFQLQTNAQAQISESKACPSSNIQTPAGHEASDIQFAILKGGPGSTIILTGDYLIDTTIELLDGVSLCSIKGATLTWSAPNRAGMLISGLRARGTSVRNLILDGRGIMIKGTDHTVESNLIRNIMGGSDAKQRWGERHGVFVADQGKNVVIRNNLFLNIIDTGIMAYGLDQSTISDNNFQGVSEGIHLWSCKDTVVRKNSGHGFKAMSIEVQGDNHPGLIIENNSFKKWHKSHEKGAYAMSVVAGQSAVVKGNTIEGTPSMAAGLEVGGIGATVLGNRLVDVDLVITDAPNTLIKDNTLTRGRIVKDVNKAKFGTLTIQENTIIDPPKVGIYADHWWGFDQVTIAGNIINKRISVDTPEFAGIQVVDFDKQALLIHKNQITVYATNGKAPLPTARITCLANGGYKGNMKGTQIVGNTCDGGNIGTFSTSSSQGGHIGVIYRDNKLLNLKDTIVGDSEGLQATGNHIDNVTNDQARMKGR
ncbi:MAG: right-handed parallel beta-helix repeat-containing protein [Aquabacterium sp.]|uniref:right-handed parallel beta-helix repeat-containing protein n=1 Tax=Aquabacterium sp. TaxID=1872578 RepID=UPI0025C69FD1|nr:right-handed parallel beta-helix repeat-containing protein [Aquabacterium sp.]MBI5926418.1 right-handed parallel beta-helix repeat-containing protein [Aquabacterium sp.]